MTRGILARTGLARLRPLDGVERQHGVAQRARREGTPAHLREEAREDFAQEGLVQVAGIGKLVSLGQPRAVGRVELGAAREPGLLQVRSRLHARLALEG